MCYSCVEEWQYVGNFLMDHPSIQEALELATVVQEPEHFDEMHDALGIWIERLQAGEVAPASGQSVLETVEHCRKSQDEIRLAQKAWHQARR